MPKESGSIQKRKTGHLRIALSEAAQTGDPGFSRYRFIHNALPEINFVKIDVSTEFIGKKVNYPFFISCMTGGAKEGKRINQNLAKAAQKYGIAMGIGSQRAAIEHPELAELFTVREVAPDIPLMANIGLVQLNYGFGVDKFQQIVDMIEADALAVHVNPIQEIIQPEGNQNWENLLPKLERVIKKLSVPVIVKEVGFGLSEDAARRFCDIGVRFLDTAGWGGTNWAMVEGERRAEWERIGRLFGEWGIPTTESIIMCHRVAESRKEKVTVLGSGGVRTGVDVAKVIALGADLAGIAAPFAKAAIESSNEVEKLIENLALELKISMFGVGAKNITELKKAHLEDRSGFAPL